MIIIDVEIEKAILGRNEERIEGIEYCNGWRDFEGMGLSVACTFDTDTQLSRAFFKEDMSELADYVHGKPTAGFNTRRFDLELLSLFSVSVDPTTHFDVLECIWVSLGLNPDRFSPATHGGWGLDKIMQATFGVGKSGHGALAPVWWQQGKRGVVVDYCLRDVWLEAKLVVHCLQGRKVMRSEDCGVYVRLPEGI